MKRVAVAILAFACSASSEPRTPESMSSPPPPPVALPADAPAPLPATTDATEIVTVDAPSPAPDRPMTPRTIYPIIKLEPDENGTRVTIGIGKDQGVNKTWKAHLVDKEGRAIRRGELTLVFVGERTTSATTKLRIDDVPKNVQAHIQTN